MAGPQMVGALFYNVGTQGWSEVYPLIAVTYANAVTAIEQLLTDRLPMLPTDVTVVGYRISDPNVFGDSVASVVNTPGTYGSGGAPVIHPPSATPNIAIELKARQGFIHRSTRYLHGVPQDQIVGGAYVPTGPFDALMTTFRSDLVANVAIMKADRTSTPPVFSFFSPITVSPPSVLWTRKTGRPFGAHPGRRRIRVSP